MGVAALEQKTLFQVRFRPRAIDAHSEMPEPYGLVHTPVFPLCPRKQARKLRLVPAETVEGENVVDNDRERMVRIEEGLKNLNDLLKNFMFIQEALNVKNATLHERVLVMEARAKGAWWMVLQIGGFTSVAAGFIAWLIAHLRQGM